MPKKSLNGFEKLFPGSEKIQTVKSIQAAASAANSNPSTNTSSATTVGSGSSLSGSNTAKSENTIKSQNTEADLQSKPGLKTERTSSVDTSPSGKKIPGSNQNESNSKPDYDPGNYIKNKSMNIRFRRNPILPQFTKIKRSLNLPNRHRPQLLRAVDLLRK
ncbi:hypothetical protein LEP1GSC170_3184 [Leptospira interrogans serovar Bataviae str. HAI135]|nr:hypothetical protein LEP1GSC170_3184 [Leptospira interrogans serovar Bataviae str. HAI135]